MFKLTLLFLWPRFYAQTSSLSSPFVKYLYKYVPDMPFDFVRLLLCYRAEEEPEGRREVCLVLDFKMNVIKWKLHFVSCNFGLKSNL